MVFSLSGFPARSLTGLPAPASGQSGLPGPMQSRSWRSALWWSDLPVPARPEIPESPVRSRSPCLLKGLSLVSNRLFNVILPFLNSV